jgi:DNA-binding response OmpR family regulator
MARILVVDDEQRIREVIREYAEFNGYEVAEAVDGMDAVVLCRENDFDLIVMDVMMPKLDGFSAVKEIRKLKNIPVIMLSARGEEYDKLFAFEVGVDDYMVKPFSSKELMARVSAVLNRITPQENTKGKIVFDGLVANLPAREVTVDGGKIELTPKEYELLVFLMQNKNIALARDVLLSDVWGYDFGDDSRAILTTVSGQALVRTIDTHVKNLRNALGPYRGRIVTLRGVGYKFEG